MTVDNCLNAVTAWSLLRHLNFSAPFQWNTESDHKFDSTSLTDYMKAATPQAKINQLPCVGPPIHKLPSELWSHVFTYVCIIDDHWKDEDTRDEDGYSLHLYNHPYMRRTRQKVVGLSHVCSHWRGIIHATPSLWSSISLNLVGLRKRDARPIIRLFLKHSGKHPLKIELADIDTDGDGERTKQSLNALRLLLREAEKWKSFRLNLGMAWDAIDIENPKDLPAPFSFPTLESFRFDSTEDSDEDSAPNTTRWLWDAIRDAPKLTTVVTHNFLDVDMIPYHQLTTLEIAYLTQGTARFFQILEACPKLANLTVSRWFSADAISLTRPVEHIHLRKLSVSGSEPPQASLAFLLDSLILPSLVNLHIGMSWHRRAEHSWPLPSFIAMLRRSSCSLETLSLGIGVRCISNNFMSDTFSAIPTLSQLHLSFGYTGNDEDLPRAVVLTSDILAKLTIPPSLPLPPIFLPNLKELCLQYPEALEGVRQIAEEGLKQLVESRSKTGLEARECPEKVSSLVVCKIVFPDYREHCSVGIQT
ncbi:hypothetical protein WG66_007745 [Moniliophthora roreri]|nr:hypothetical protein WG66_007745 [Moniliophthora roreri]